MEVQVPQVKRCRPSSGTGASENAVLRDLEKEVYFLLEAQFKMCRPKIGRNPPLFLGTMM